MLEEQSTFPTPAAAAPADGLLAGGGEMGALIRATDWARTPLGAIETWPQSLRTAVSIMLNSRYPMFVWWGRELTNLYNDAYIPVLGARHPRALGRSAPDIWADIWAVVGPQAMLVLNEGRATWNESVLLVMERYGFAEETYFTFSYSPVPDDAGSVGGVFCACTEDTGRVIGERRLRLLKALAEAAVNAETDSQACERASQALAEAGADLPFALLYLVSADGQRAHLAGSAGLRPGAPASPLAVNLAADGGPWPLDVVASTSQPVLIEDLRAQYPNLPGGPWPDPAHAAMVLPISAAGQERPTGFLVAGLSPRRAFDDDYRAFLQLVAGHIASAIADARALEAERRRAEALAEIDRAKTAFFSNVSHEFRTPLTLLLGPLEAALAAADDEMPAQRTPLAMAHRNALRLLKMVNALLDFARLEAGRMQAAYVATDLAALTTELASMFRAAIERAGLRLVVDCPPLPEPVYVDRELWEKVVLNLLSNALKFTHAGQISVELAWAGDAAELRVCDTGIGISPEDQASLFTRFHRIRGAHARTHEGTGIGLALVQELARLHGGSVRVESSPGQGSCFNVRVPAGRAHLPADRIGGAEEARAPTLVASAYVLEAFGWLPVGPGLGEAPDTAWETDPGFSTDAAARVLVADDNADMRAYLGRLLGQHWQVELAADGREALTRARATLPDLVLTDVMMPGLDGFELLRALRADPDTRAVPVVLLSARAGEEARVEGLSAGADDYLVKPFSARELVARVEAQLRMTRQRRELLDQVQAQADQLRLIADSLPVLIAYVDADHRYQFNNRGYRDWFGHEPAALRGQHLREALGAEAYTALRPYIDKALRGERVTFEAEVPYLHGGRRPVHGNYVPHTDAHGNVLGFYALVTDTSERKAAEAERAQYAQRLEDQVAARTIDLRSANEALEQSQDELRRLSAYLQRVREHERTWMAREIHDELGQQLTGLKMDVAALRKRLGVNVKGEMLADLTSAIDGAIQTVRRLATELRPSILDDFGLVAAMEAHLSEFQRRAGVETRLSATADETRLSDDARTALFRILQEALTNIARHAEATQVTVVLEETGGGLALEIRDNGRGISDEALTGTRSLGLLGMRERVRLLAGELIIAGAPGEGTVVRVMLPPSAGAIAT